MNRTAFRVSLTKRRPCPCLRGIFNKKQKQKQTNK
ncbi:rCG44518 [Rattus norvegicus]|uniref:RCG44518 n=1 Tax=Rattus norvegicus TaxID=10116 RepID=A6I545_RAT|nr:rCG44518 [Rattus norvegicus]